MAKWMAITLNNIWMSMAHTSSIRSAFFLRSLSWVSIRMKALILPSSRYLGHFLSWGTMAKNWRTSVVEWVATTVENIWMALKKVEAMKLLDVKVVFLPSIPLLHQV